MSIARDIVICLLFKHIAFTSCLGVKTATIEGYITSGKIQII